MDLLEKIKPYFTGEAKYWKLNSAFFSEGGFPHYPLSFRDRLYQGHYLNFDSDGIPMFPSKTGELVHFCTGMCSFAFANWEEYIATGEKKFAEEVVKIADYLMGFAEKREDGSVMFMDYDNDKRENPVACAMNQGEAISVLCRAYYYTQNTAYKAFAIRAFAPFTKEYGHSGVSRQIEGIGHWFLEGGKVILNGHNYASFGLYDLYNVSKDELVKEWFDKGTSSVANALPEFDKGNWSWYWIDKPKYIASGMYHNLHICQLQALQQITGNKIFDRYVNKFEGYSKSGVRRMGAALTIAAMKVKRKLLK